MSIEIVVRPASAISVLKHQSVKPATASEDNDAVIEWGNGPLGLAERMLNRSRPSSLGTMPSKFLMVSAASPAPLVSSTCVAPE